MFLYLVRLLAADDSPLIIRQASWLGIAAALADAADGLPDDCAYVELAYPDGSVFWSGTRDEVLRLPSVGS